MAAPQTSSAPSLLSSTLNQKLLAVAVLLASLFACLYLLLVRIAFSLQPEYDDKGYMLLSLSHFVKEGGLYTRTFTQYGPFYFLLQPFVYKLLHLTISNDGSVLVTFFYLVCSCLLFSAFVQRLTGMWSLAVVCFLASASTGFAIFQECGHPQEVVLLLLAVGVYLSLAVSGRFSSAALFLLGCAGAALALTKINVGIFFFFAIWFAMAVSLRRGLTRRLLYAAIAAICVLVPPVLMQAHFAHWSIPFCIFTVIVLLGLCWAGSRIKVADPWSGSVLWFVIVGAAISCGAVLAWGQAQGISAHDLVSGIILRPWKHPGVFTMPLILPWPVLCLTAAASFAVGAAFYYRERIPNFERRLGICKMIVGPFGLLSLSVIRVGLVFNAPLLPLLLLAPSKQECKRSTAFPRLFLCAVLAFELLQDYPVAATHLNVTLTGTAAWALLLTYDGWLLLRERLGRRRLWTRALTPAGCAILASVLTGVLWAKAAHRQLHVGPPLDLPGSRYLHLTPDYSARFRWLAATIHENCDRLYGLPELGSVNFWARVPTPNGLNMGAWPLAFTHAEQQSVVDVLRRTSRVCIVHNEKVRHFWAPYGEPHDAPLIDYIFRETVPVSHSGDYEIRVPPRSLSTWREDVILDHAKPLTGDPLGLPEDLLAGTPESTIRFSVRTDRGKLSVTSWGGNTAGLPHLQIDAGHIELRTGPTASSATVPTMDDGHWHQLTLVTTPATHQLFVDGSLKATVTSAAQYALPGSLYLLSGTAQMRDFKVVRHAWDTAEVLQCFRRWGD